MSDAELLEKTIRDLEWSALLAHLASGCHSERARAQAGGIELLSCPEAIERLFGLVDETRALEQHGTPLPLEDMSDPRTNLLRLDKEGALGSTALMQVGRALAAMARLARFARSHAQAAPALAQLAAGITPLDPIWGAIEQSFEPTGELRDDASDELAKLRHGVSRLHRRVTQRMRELLEAPHISKHLQDHFYTQREDRYVLPIRADAGPLVDGIVLGSSSSGATMFVEPKEVIQLNNELKVAKVDVAREELRLLAQLSSLVAEHIPAILHNLDITTEIDLISARAHLAARMDAHRPTLEASGRLYLQKLRHPLLVLAGTDVVPSDVELDPGHTLIISGPNAGGKTVCLKSLGLCALMTRAGIPLPAGPDSCIPVYRRVLTDIGDDQSIVQSLSTFTGHLRYLKEFLQLADDRTLILLDEVISGTDPDEGSALAQALLEAFAARSAQIAVTTHYQRLKVLPLHDERFVNASVGFDLRSWQPTYLLHAGTPGSSFALTVARQLGVDDPIVTRSEELVGDRETQVADLLREITDQQSRLARREHEAEEARIAATQAEQHYGQKLEQLRQRASAELTRSHSEALDDLKRARAEIRRARELMKRPISRAQVEQADQQISEAARHVQRHAPARLDPTGHTPAPDELTPGSRVWTRSLRGFADVVEQPRPDEVVIQLGGMRARTALSDLIVPHDLAHRPKTTPKNQGGAPPRGAAPASATAVERTIDNTLDVRGMRVDEALRATEAFVDASLLAGRDVMFVLHGHGSGALRAAVRTDVGLCAGVERVLPGSRDQGGDAVTVVVLR